MKKLLSLLLFTASCIRPPGPVVPLPPPTVPMTGVVGSYHGPLGADTLMTLATVNGFTLRSAVENAQQAQAVADSLKPYPALKVLWLIEGANDAAVQEVSTVAQMFPQTWGIELGNELDLAGLTPQQFGAFVLRNYSWLREHFYKGRIVSGGIYSVQPETLKYLEDAGVASWPMDLIVGIHRYGDPDSSAYWATRDGETRATVAALHGHTPVITEFGYPTHTQADEAWAAEAVKKDLTWFGKLAAPLVTEYQITDGTSNDNIDHFGIRATDGRWKPVSVSLGLRLPEPVTTLSFDLVACRTPFVDNYCDGPPGAIFAVEVGPNIWKTFQGDGNGYAFAQGIPNVPDSHLIITTPGYQDLSAHISPPTLVATNAKGIHNHWTVVPAHVDPSTRSLESLIPIRGGMWPQTVGACGNTTLGPRPGQATNIFATVFLDEYPKAEIDCMLTELNQHRGYTHAVVGPLVDSDGYHGIWKPQDHRGAEFEKFLDMIQRLWDAGLAPIVFIKPDGWSVEQTESELTSLLQQPRAQRLIRLVVPMGWEAGANYEYSSCSWAEIGRWSRSVLPNALTLIHMVADRDAPAGVDARCDDDNPAQNPNGNAGAWARVVPYFHGWLVQNSAFECPTCVAPNGKTNFQNFQDQFNPSVTGSYMQRFGSGYANWPRGSAWGANTRLRVFNGEATSFWRFWYERTEAEGMDWGDAATRAGSDGYLDGGRIVVPVFTP